MVRFKDNQQYKAVCVFYCVSIPIWFDLKYSRNPDFSQLFLCFNSYMVRFKEIHPRKTLFYVFGFNSYMVRFKAVFGRSPALPKLRFNSYMVRFKVTWRNVAPRGGKVSIPIWFDLKKKEQTYYIIGFEFQFLYGSI